MSLFAERQFAGAPRLNRCFYADRGSSLDGDVPMNGVLGANGCGT